MKKTLLIVLTVIFCLVPTLITAQGDEEIDIGGFWKFDYRFLIGNGREDVPYYDIFSRLRLNAEAYISDNVTTYISGDFRLYGSSDISGFNDLSDPAAQYPTDAMLWEAYLDIYNLGIDGLDLRVGKQRIAWGTADKMNPTDNFNPDDFSDFFEFGEHVPSLAVRATYNVSTQFAVEFVWLPSVKPILLPKDLSFSAAAEVENLLAPYKAQINQSPVPITITEPNIYVTTPPYDLSHSMQALKIKGTLAKIDYSVSYLHGYDDFPVPTSIELIPNQTDQTLLQPEVQTGFFEYHVLGFDFAGELSGIGWWAEGAVFLPTDGVDVIISIPDMLNPMEITHEEIELLNTDPYFKSTVGCDYTFSGGTYINFQYMHGLFPERGNEENINDYFLFKIEQKLSHDRIKLGLAGIYSVLDWDDIGSNYAVVVNPEIMWLPFGSVELSFGGLLIDSKGESFFSSFKDLDMLYMKMKVYF
jgi:hypothetical protein